MPAQDRLKLCFGRRRHGQRAVKRDPGTDHVKTCFRITHGRGRICEVEYNTRKTKTEDKVPDDLKLMKLVLNKNGIGIRGSEMTVDARQLHLCLISDPFEDRFRADG